MAKSIEEVKGIGPASAALLSAAGIGTVKKLAAASIARVSAVKGFSETRAAMVIENAKTLLAAEEKPPAKKKAAKLKSTKTVKTTSKKKTKKGDKKKKDKKKKDKKKGNKKRKK